jgi:hypothetical protein
MENLLYTETEAAKLLAISTSTLQKSRTKTSTAIANGLLPPFIKLRGSVRYTKQDLIDFVDNLGAKPTKKKSKHVVNIVEEPEIPAGLKGLCGFLN